MPDFLKFSQLFLLFEVLMIFKVLRNFYWSSITKHRPLIKFFSPSLSIELLYYWLFLGLESHWNSAIKKPIQVCEFDVLPNREKSWVFGTILKTGAIFSNSYKDFSTILIGIVVFCSCNSLFKNFTTFLKVVIVL